MTIDAKRIPEIFTDSLYRDEELSQFHDKGLDGGAVPADAVPAKGLMANVMFNPVRLESHREEITRYLLNLPEPFMASKGGGWSFLQACEDKDGNQWTGLHMTMDQLFTLGSGLGLVDFVLPREMWSALPGGMPYMVVKDADVVPTPAG